MSTPITGSPNITSLDSKIVSNYCNGNFEIDVSPSVFLPGGTGLSGGVQGANVRITNPLGVVIKQYFTSGFDINPPMSEVFSFAIPTTAGNFQYGTYTIDVKLTDDDGTEYVVTKTINLCPPDPNNKNKKYGCLNAKIRGNCKDGKVVILLDQPPNFKGKAFTSQVIDMELQYPTSSGLANLEDIAYASFSVALYEGEYILTGTTCVLYDYGDNVFFKVNYKINCRKDIRCIIDLCCVQAKWDELAARLDSDCTDAEAEATRNIIIESQFYVTAAQGAANCGTDPSDWISKLELLLGCVCTCNCNEGTPIIDNTPAKDFLIEGCNVEKETVGLTDNYTINVYDYTLVNDDTTGVLSVTDVAQDGCTKEQRINIDVDAILAMVPAATGLMYRGILTQSSTSIPTASVDQKNVVTIAYTRIGAGSYVGTVSGTFTPLTQDNTHILLGKTANVLIKANWLSANSFSIVSADPSTAIAADSLIDHVPIELNILDIAS